MTAMIMWLLRINQSVKAQYIGRGLLDGFGAELTM